jgi:hypothetical protein
MSQPSPTLAGVRENKASFLAEVEADRDNSARLSPHSQRKQELWVANMEMKETVIDGSEIEKIRIFKDGVIRIYFRDGEVIDAEIV